MDAFLQELVGDGEITWKAFEPVARYHPNMDVLIYVKEDCSYRADRVDAFLTVLRYPHNDELVGLKLKGFRFLFQQLQSIIPLSDEEWLPLVRALELALVGGVGQSMMDAMEAQRVESKYQQAKHLAKDVSLSPRDWALAA